MVCKNCHIHPERRCVQRKFKCSSYLGEQSYRRRDRRRSDHLLRRECLGIYSDHCCHRRWTAYLPVAVGSRRSIFQQCSRGNERYIHSTRANAGYLVPADHHIHPEFVRLYRHLEHFKGNGEQPGSRFNRIGSDHLQRQHTGAAYKSQSATHRRRNADIPVAVEH